VGAGEGLRARLDSAALTGPALSLAPLVLATRSLPSIFSAALLSEVGLALASWLATILLATAFEPSLLGPPFGAAAVGGRIAVDSGPALSVLDIEHGALPTQTHCDRFLMKCNEFK
jgi:hypothetical protein